MKSKGRKKKGRRRRSWQGVREEGGGGEGNQKRREGREEITFPCLCLIITTTFYEMSQSNVVKTYKATYFVKRGMFANQFLISTT